MSRDVFGCHNWWWYVHVCVEDALASNGQRSGMLLNILNACGSPPQRRITQPQMPTLPLLRKPRLKDVLFSTSVSQEIISTSCFSLCILYQSNCGGNGAVDMTRTDLHVWNLSNLPTVFNLSNESKSTHHSQNEIYYIILFILKDSAFLDFRYFTEVFYLSSST